MGAAAHDRISRAYRWEQGAADIVDLAQAGKPSQTQNG